MALTDEQHAMLQTIHHQIVVELPKRFKALEASNNARYVVLRNKFLAIGAGGAGATAEEMAKEFADEIAKRMQG